MDQIPHATPHARFDTGGAVAYVSEVLLIRYIAPENVKAKVMSTEFLKSMTRRALLTAAAGVPLLALGEAQAAGLAQTAVSYQATPKDGKKCVDCKLFVAPKSCKSVSGDIAPEGWCKLWVKKA